MRWQRRALVLVAACLPLVLGSCGASERPDTSGTSSAGPLCAARLRVGDAAYDGVGGLRRDPEVTGEEVAAVVPGCGDSGDAAPDQDVVAQALAGIPTDTALLLGGDVYVRRGRELPGWTRRWRTTPRCSTPGTFEVSGVWLGVDGRHEPAYDGDIQLPYRIQLHVEAGPEAYVGALLTVVATRATDPALGSDDVRSSLWQGGTVSAQVECHGDRFRAVGLSSAAP